METILITGASRGIGRAIAQKLCRTERNFFLHGRDREALAETQQLVEQTGATATSISGDLGKKEGIDALFSQLKNQEIHMLIHNAGIVHVNPIEKISLESWNQLFAVNVTAPFLLTQKLLPNIPRGGSIVHILSVAAKQGFPEWSSYCASKFALEGFSQGLREELRGRGIRVINIYPSATDTDIWNQVPGEWSRETMLNAEEVGEAVRCAVDMPANTLVENITIGSISGLV